MIDLSPDSHDNGPATAELQSRPRHDPLTAASEEAVGSERWRYLSHERAESAVQWLSRWAGPAVLAGAVAAIIWWIAA